VIWPVRQSRFLGIISLGRDVKEGGAKARLKQAAHWTTPGFLAQSRCGYGSKASLEC
jgi:hypothetical protein